MQSLTSLDYFHTFYYTQFYYIVHTWQGMLSLPWGPMSPPDMIQSVGIISDGDDAGPRST